MAKDKKPKDKKPKDKKSKDKKSKDKKPKDKKSKDKKSKDKKSKSGKRPKPNPALSQALEADDLNAVIAALDAGIPPDALSEAFDLDTQDAIKVALIREGAAVEPGRLVWAVTTGFPEVVAAYLEAGDDVEDSPPLGTPLQVAASLGHAAIVRLLLEHKANPDQGNAIGTPLSAAVEAGHEDCARMLLDAGADPLRRAPFQAVEVLVRAADEGMFAVVEALLVRGVDVEARGTRLDLDPESGRLREAYASATALISAARKGHIEIVRRLLEVGAKRDAFDDSGKTALRHATETGHDQTAELLLQHGAAVDPPLPPDLSLMLAIDRDDQTALDAALSGGADPNGGDPRKRTHGTTPLGRAARLGRTGIVRRLLGVSADPHGQDPDGLTPAAVAAQQGHAEILGILSEAGADLDAKLDGRVALHFAVEGGHLEAARVLLSAGARVDARQPHGDTPLMRAVSLDHGPLVALLLEAGANPLLGTGWGEDVQALASSCATQEVQDLVAGAVARAQG